MIRELKWRLRKYFDLVEGEVHREILEMYREDRIKLWRSEGEIKGLYERIKQLRDELERSKEGHAKSALKCCLQDIEKLEAQNDPL